MLGSCLKALGTDHGIQGRAPHFPHRWPSVGATLVLGVRIHSVCQRKKFQSGRLPPTRERRSTTMAVLGLLHTWRNRGLECAGGPAPWAGRAGAGQCLPCSVYNWLSKDRRPPAQPGGDRSLGPTWADLRAVIFRCWCPTPARGAHGSKGVPGVCSVTSHTSGLSTKARAVNSHRDGAECGGPRRFLPVTV